MEKKLPENDPLRGKLSNVIEMLNSSNLSIRRILNELRPSSLDDFGLDEALRALNQQFSRQSGLPVEFRITGNTELVPEPVTTCIYRIYQEALTNILRHAGASLIKTTLEIRPDQLTFTIEDDGVGFEPEHTLARNKFGILGMKERAAAVSGTCTIDSQLSKGTRIRVEIPYKAINSY